MEKNEAEKVIVELEKFESTFVLPGFGRDAVAAGRVVEHVIAKCSATDSALKVLWVKVARGQFVFAGDAVPSKLKAAVSELSREVSDICRNARLQQSPLAAPPTLPRSAEDS